MKEYDPAFDPEAAFAASAAAHAEMIDTLRGHAAARDWDAATAEEFGACLGREAIRLALQGFADTGAVAEEHARCAGEFPPPVDAEGVAHRASEVGRDRILATQFGDIRIRRVAWRATGRPNLHPRDAQLNLPEGQHSHPVAKPAAHTAAHGSFAGAADVLARTNALVLAPGIIRALAIGAAADFDAFYNLLVPEPRTDEEVLVLSADGKGIVMRPKDLREDTRKKAQAHAERAGRLSGGHRPGRKRMSTVGAVYDAEPAVRRPHDIITLADPTTAKPKKKDTGGSDTRPGPKARHKWLIASVKDTTAEVIAKIFKQATARDPDHRRTWVVLVDGANAQIDAINAEAAACGAEIHVLIDFVHVLQYLGAAARGLHGEGPAADTAVATWALQTLNGHAEQVTAELADAAETPGRTAEDRKKINEAVTYLHNKNDYLRYANALARGWPIATGVIEGACRHLIADRMDITGARWSLEGAEAVLKLRALIANGDFDSYWAFHLKQEHRRNHQARYQQLYQLAA